jgi:hypothetical protein
MKLKIVTALLTLFILAQNIHANTGDTTTVRTHNASHWNWYGQFDNWAVFPDTSHHYRKITLKYKLGCPSAGCSQWDYTTQIFILRHTGTYDSTASQLPYFTVNGNTTDSSLFSTMQTYTHFFDTLTSSTDSVLSSQLQIVLYQNSSTPTIPTDTIYEWPANYWNYTYNASGNIVDSTWVPSDSTLYNSFYTVYHVFEVIDPIEISRYITPYAGNLTASWNNTWEFDVSDYAPLLHDSVEVRAFYSGWSDGFTITLDFEMIEGTPPRTPIRVTNLWSGYYPYGNPGNSIENYLVPKTEFIAANELNSTVRFDITGHGFGGTEDCSEFCPKMYYMKFDGTTHYSNLVWRDKCGMNANAAQPGTWLYDRANWCPGEAVHVFQNELTPFVTPGDSVVIDADMQPYTNLDPSHGAGYQIDGQLITYGAPNFTLDAELREIVTPSNVFNVHRYNPICNSPIIIIRNDGTTPLTSLLISYGVTGAPISTYTWNGTLNFLETDTVVLPTLNWFGTAPVFSVSISNPNGGNDQLADNNALSTTYVAAPQYISDLVFSLRTNNVGSDTYWELKDAAGNIVISRSNLNNATTYNDTLHLAPGCYSFRLTDASKDGLSFWANNSGTGLFRIKNANTGAIIKSFNSDFGTELYQEFTVGYTIGVPEIPLSTEFDVYPNPTTGNITVDVQSADEQVEVVVFDFTGKIVSDEKVNTEHTMQSLNIDLSGYAPGLYFVQMRSSEGIRYARVIKE